MDEWYKLPEGLEITLMYHLKEEGALDIFIERKDENYRRVKEDISFDELMQIFENSKMHWVCIKRKPEQNPIGHDSLQHGEWKNYTTYYEIGGCTLGHESGRDYFLFLFLTEEHGDLLVKGLKNL